MLAPALQLTICVVMLRRKLIREFPCFFGYTMYHVFRYAALFTVRLTMPRAAYFDSYWLAQMISAILGFAVIHEIYQHVFRNYEALRTLGA